MNKEFFLLGKCMALIEDLYIGMNRNANDKNDYSHKILLLQQEIEKLFEINKQIK